MADPRTVCWRCTRCGWVDCYTAADLKQYGAPTECQNNYHESLVEIDLVEGLEALADKATVEVRKATRSLADAQAEAAQLEHELTLARSA